MKELSKAKRKAYEVLYKKAETDTKDSQQISDALEELLDALNRKESKIPSGAEAAKYISQFLNVMVTDKKGFIKAMGSEHRTLQQEFTGLCVLWLEEFSNRKDFDARNQASVELGKEFVERIAPDKRALPFI